MKLLITRPFPGRTIDAARESFDVTLRESNAPMARDELVAALRDFDAVMATLGDGFSREIFEEAGKIRAQIIANFGVGYNHIDVAAARDHVVAVTNTPGVVTDATADIAMTLILMTARRAGEGERLVRSGGWTSWHPSFMLGTHVTAKTVGVIGMGRIGQAIARRCHFGFGMDVVYYNRSPKALDFRARALGSIEEVAGAADFVVVAVPGGAETHHLIGAETFRAMQPSGIFINIARGDVVDEAALVAALQAGEIAGAGLDVYEREPEVSAGLLTMENVTLLPHLGTSALEVREAMGMMALENLVAFAENRDLPNAV